MFDVQLEPEVEDWLAGLSFPFYQRVMRNVDDYLVDRGDILDGNHTKALRQGVRELRVILVETSWRLTYWLPSGRGPVIVLLTVFQKTREGSQDDDVDRAVKGQTGLPGNPSRPCHPYFRKEPMMAGHSKWKTMKAARLADQAVAHSVDPDYVQAGLDLRLGDMVRSRRIELGLTQAEVAHRAQISQPALSRIEGGGGVPTLAMLDRIARAMETTFTITVGQDVAA